MSAIYTPQKKPLNDLLARVQALDSATKENPKRKREERAQDVSKRLNDMDSPKQQPTELPDVTMDEPDSNAPAMPYADHSAAYPTIFRATPKNLSVKAHPPNSSTHIYKRPSLDNSSEHSPNIHPDSRSGNHDTNDDDVIVIENLTPKKQYMRKPDSASKVRGGRISEAYKMTPRRKITREMLMPDGDDEESVNKENDNIENKLQEDAMLFQQISLAVSSALFGAMPVIAAPLPMPFSMSSQKSQMVSPDLIRAAQASEPIAIKDVDSHDLTCGRGASVQHQDHPVKIDAGSKLQIQWSDDWKHTVGPIMTYLAECRENNCEESDVTTLDWFKIDEKAADLEGDWWQSHLGDERDRYIVRHEVIVIDQDPVLFFPACAALDIQNGGDEFPTSNYTVQIPGAYSATDKGLQTVEESFDPYNYVFPGPSVWKPTDVVESASFDGFYSAAEMDVHMTGDAYQVQFLAPNVTSSSTSSVDYVSSTATTLYPSQTMSMAASKSSTTSSSKPISTANFYHAQLAPLPSDSTASPSSTPSPSISSTEWDDGSWNKQKYDDGKFT
ncbi:hypothetical protein E3Q13_00307 [Wallemia mellicola]|nr:hypothetical protein E3Q13_00307 [Wallemia mellicola]